MQNENMAEDKHLTKDRIRGHILLLEDKIEIHVYGPANWVDDFIRALDRFGVKLAERFRSPCG